EEDPKQAAVGLAARRVEMERSEALGGQDRSIHLQFPETRTEVERAHGPRLLHLMLRIQVLEEYPQRSAAVERDAQALGAEARARLQELPAHLPDPNGSSAEAGEPLLERFRHQASDPIVVHLSAPGRVNRAHRSEPASDGVASARRPPSSCSRTSQVTTALVR